MKKLLQLFSFFLLLVSVLAIPLNASGNSSIINNKIEKKFLKKINSDMKKQRKAVVYLKSSKQIPTINGESKLSRTQVFTELRKTAGSAQKSLVQSLKESKAKDKVINFQSLWLINAVAVEASGEEITRIANRTDIEKIIEDFKIEIEKPKPSRTLPKKSRSSGGSSQISPMAAGNIEWNIKRINAHKVWDEGYDGTGVRVGVIDTGADGTHPDLTGKVELFSKFDNNNNIVTSSFTGDFYGHGTHVSGIIVGGDASGTSIGVAPGAKLIVNSFGWWFTFSNAIKAMEWTIDPDSNPATDDGASVVNMSWGAYMELPLFFEPLYKMISAGVLPVAAIGNAGKNMTGSPGNVPSAFGVGATNKLDNVTPWSSGGEVEFFDEPFIGKWIKPDISAPGDSIKSAISGLIKDWEIGGGDDQWMELSGTSMAAPHIAGAAALLKQYKPSLTPEQIRLLLEASSKDRGEEAKDIRYGSGRLNVKKALDFAKTAGTLTGRVTYSGKAVDANIKVVEPGTFAKTNPKGYFKTMVPSGSYTLEISSYGYLPQTISDVEVQEDGTTALGTISLSKSPFYKVSGKVTAETTGKPVPSAIVSITGKEIIGITAFNGNYSLKVPAGKYTLAVKANGFESKRVPITVAGNLTENIQMVLLPEILLVNDFWGNNYISYYKNALDSLGKEYTLSKSASAAKMKQYKIVILASEDIPSALWPGWRCIETDGGHECFPTKSPAERYLDSGGRLFLAGQDIGYYLNYWHELDLEEDMPEEAHWGNFLSKYLYVKYIADNSKNRTLKGVPDTLMDGMNFSIYNIPGETNDGANNQVWPDVMKSINTKFSKGILRYTVSTESDIGTGKGSGAGFAVNTGTYKVICLTFGFEGIGSASSRKAVMNKSLNWLKR